MKKKILLFSALAILTSISASNIEFSKDSVQPINKWVFKVGVNTVDSSGDAKASDMFSSFDQMAFSGTPVKINIERRLNRIFAFEVAGSLNKWKAGKGVIDSDYDDHRTLTQDQDYFAVDGNLKLYVDEALRLFRGSDWLELYISGGVGYFKVTEGGTTGNVGSGFNLWFSESIGLNFETVAKWILDSEPAPYDTGHMQYSLGLAFRGGDQDQDNDGIYDYNDKCPNIAGSKRNDGCPSDVPPITLDPPTDYDRDNDGVKDNVDRCPDIAGLASNDGCPSSDGDGDGVIDTADNCPTIAGLPSNNGCPIVDTDGDVVIDSADNCPTIVGVASNGGCPSKPVTNNNNNNNGGSSFLSMTRKIQFNTGKYSFTNEAYSALQAIVSYMKQNPGSIYRIQGHADSVGTDSNNRALSVKRAKAVKNYLVDNGISSEIITTEGFGESNPLELNSTKQGRAINRRIEIIEIR